MQCQGIHRFQRCHSHPSVMVLTQPRCHTYRKHVAPASFGLRTNQTLASECHLQAKQSSLHFRIAERHRVAAQLNVCNSALAASFQSSGIKAGALSSSLMQTHRHPSNLPPQATHLVQTLSRPRYSRNVSLYEYMASQGSRAISSARR